MISRKKITRRAFLTGAISTGVLLLAQFIPSEDSQDILEEKIILLLKNRKSAVTVGLEYLELVPEEDNRAKLLSIISSTLKENSYPFNTGTTLAELRKQLGLCRQNDFEEGRVVELDAWLLSVTEARLCALVTIRIPTFINRIILRYSVKLKTDID